MNALGYDKLVVPKHTTYNTIEQIKFELAWGCTLIHSYQNIVKYLQSMETSDVYYSYSSTLFIF